MKIPLNLCMLTMPSMHLSRGSQLSRNFTILFIRSHYCSMETMRFINSFTKGLSNCRILDVSDSLSSITAAILKEYKLSPLMIKKPMTLYWRHKELKEWNIGLELLLNLPQYQLFGLSLSLTEFPKVPIPLSYVSDAPRLIRLWME